MKFEYMIDQVRHQIEIEAKDGGYVARIGEKVVDVKIISSDEQAFELEIDGQKMQANWAIDGKIKRWVAFQGREWLVEKATRSKRSGSSDSKSNESQVFAPMPGQVRQVLVSDGDSITAGQLLFILEAMKMEIRVLSPRDGTVSKLHIEIGQQVDKDDLLLEIE
jgi:biotin carboxyl carrier protein